jgi:anti-sigma B factor antagonist
MAVSTRAAGPVTIIDVSGDLKLDEGAGQLREKVRKLLDNDQKRLLVNVAGVGFVDSAGLGELVQAYATATRQGGTLKLTNPTKRLRDLLVITKLSTVFEMFDNEPAALASFAASA